MNNEDPQTTVQPESMLGPTRQIDAPRLRRRPSRDSDVGAEGSKPDLEPSSAFLASKVEVLPTATLIPYQNNPRDHGDRQINKLAGTIRSVGFLVPIIVDAQNVIVAGHGRFAAAKKLRLQNVPTIRASHLTPEQVKAFRIADNRIGELSLWNERTLAIELKELSVIEVDTEILDLTGFEIGEVDARIAILDAPEEKVDPIDDVLEPELDSAVSQLGDLWLVGKHRVFCGSSLEDESYVRLLRGVKVRAVFADPPYNVAVNGHVSGLGKTKHREFPMASGEMKEDEFIAFLASYLFLTKQHSLPGALHYSCMDAAHSFELLTAARKAGFTFKTTCTWAKTGAGMGSLYRQQTEFVHVFKNGGNDVRHINNVELGKHGRTRTTLWTYRGVNTFGRGRMEELSSHPTVKPWAMVADAIKDCTRHGETVLDPFCGSGTTLIAAEKVGRIAYGIELDPLYVDVSIRRFEKIAKQQAIHAETGLTFDELKAQRSSLTTGEV